MITRTLYLLVLILCYFALSVRANKYNTFITSGYKRNYFLLLFFIMLGILVAFRPLDISDAQPYYNRYYLEPSHTTIGSILNATSFYRGTGYSMSKPVNMLFYIFFNLHIPYQLFVLIVFMFEVSIYFIYGRKILKKYNIESNEYLLFVMLLLFYSFRYQFIAFAQGMAMCLATPILYFLSEKKYIKATVFIIISASIHIAGFYFAVIAVIYLFTPRMKMRTYALVWLISGFLSFSGLGLKLGIVGNWLANRIISMIISSNPIYTVYTVVKEGGAFSVSMFLFWLLCGVLIMVYSDQEDYWKLLNINIVSILIGSVFGGRGIVHRFTDISKMYIPILMMIYIYEARPAIILPGNNNKHLTILAVLVLGFAHSLSLLGFI